MAGLTSPGEESSVSARLPREVGFLALLPLRRFHSVAIVIVAVLVIVAVSCSNDADDLSAGGVVPRNTDRSSPVDLEQPLGPLGQEVDGAVAAGLPFIPLLPRKDGATVREFIVPTDDPSAAIAAFVYDDDDWGRFVMLQYSDTQTQHGLIGEEASQKAGGCSPVPEHGEGATTCTFAPHDVVQLGRGTSALIASGNGYTSLTWVANLHPASGYTLDAFRPNIGLTIEIRGEASEFSPTNAIAFGEAAVRAERFMGTDL